MFTVQPHRARNFVHPVFPFKVRDDGRQLTADYFRSEAAAACAARELNTGRAVISTNALTGCRVVPFCPLFLNV